MLTQLEVKNIGPFNQQGVSLEFKPLTIIIGPNNVGKSSLIYAYDLMADRQKYIHPLSSIPSFIHKPSSSNKGEISTEYLATNGTKVKKKAIIDLDKRGGTPEFEININGTPGVQSTGVERTGFEEALAFFMNTTYLLSNRTFIAPVIGIRQGDSAYTIDPLGSNIIQFLAYKFTDRDPNWPDAEDWLKKVDPFVKMLKVPLIENKVSLVTERSPEPTMVDVNLAQQGSGIQRALQIISALVFTPKNSCIIIEEPEMNLHPKAQEVIVDLINKAVNDWDKQVIFTTHSLDMLLPYASDLDITHDGRSKTEHTIINKDKCTLCVLKYDDGVVVARNDVHYKGYKDFRHDLKDVWG